MEEKLDIMKKIWTIFPLMLLISCGNVDNDWKEMGLYGKVKSVSEQQFKAFETGGKILSGEGFRDTDYDKKIEFNKDGWYSKISQFTIFGELLDYTVFKYDKENLMVERKTFNDMDSLVVIMKVEYDEKGRPVNTLHQDGEGYLTSREVIEYNDENLIETQSVYNKDNVLIRKKQQYLDRRGLPKETKIFNEKNEVVNHRKETFGDNRLLDQFTVLSSNGEEVMLVKLSYDPAGNVVSQEALDMAAMEPYLPVTYQYEFDEKGNWIRRIQFLGDEPLYVVQREIEYF